MKKIYHQIRLYRNESDEYSRKEKITTKVKNWMNAFNSSGAGEDNCSLRFSLTSC